MTTPNDIAPIGRTQDWTDPALGWTVQHGTMFSNGDSVPGQVFVPDQLPNPAAQRSVNVNPDVHNAGLIVMSPEDAALHPGGPEPRDPLAGTGVYPGLDNAGTRIIPQVPDVAPVAPPAEVAPVVEAAPVLPLPDVAPVVPFEAPVVPAGDATSAL